MEIRTLARVPVNELLHTFNESFSDYLVPLQLTGEQLASKLRSDRVDLRYSAGAFRDGKLVAFILHGIDDHGDHKHAYNAGTGVIPSERGQALTRRMYEFIFPILKKENVSRITLEVIRENLPAIKTYERIGFKLLRELVCFRGIVSPNGNEEVIIRSLPTYDWPKLRTFHDFAPSWQNTEKALELLKDTNTSFGAYLGDKLVGYFIYNPLSKRVMQFGVDPAHRREGIGSRLFNTVSEPGSTMSVINVEEGATTKFLESIGSERFAVQWEMGVG